MSDIDIERLREAVPLLADGLFDFLADTDHSDETLAALDDAIKAARFLLDLADEGGELWRETECPHGEVFRHSLCQRAEHAPSDCLGWCDGGSRVRVWPPKEHT